MNKLKQIGLTALAGTFAATTAQAVEMSVSGSVSATFSTKDTTEVTGARLSTGDSLNFSGSGETEQGWTVTSSIEVDGGTYDDRTLSVNMGDSGTIYLQSSGAQGTPASLVPNAYGSAGYSLAGAATPTGRHVADGLASGAGSDINLCYTVSAMGFDISAGITPGAQGGSDTSVSIKYADLVDGLTISAGIQKVNLNFNVPVGNDLQLGVSNNSLQTNGLYRNSSGANYPYNIGSAISITQSSASTNPFDYYYFFYNLYFPIFMQLLIKLEIQKYTWLHF